ncbi:hypothetical protein MKW92_034118 [Papaver armeniacum]|nr:hypothetical protein MKW92_034118 [Papaver armeniacum]
MSSGMCASTVMMFTLVKKGGHIITTTDCYRKTRIFIDDFLLPNMNIMVHIIDPADMDGLKFALDKNNVTLLFTESPTKPYLRCFIGGQNDVLTGCISGSEEVTSKIHKLHHVLGGTLNPNAAYLIIRGMKTLHLRAQQQNIAGLMIARMRSSAETCLLYRPAKSSEHKTAMKQMTGFGLVVTFEIDGDKLPRYSLMH